MDDYDNSKYRIHTIRNSFIRSQVHWCNLCHLLTEATSYAYRKVILRSKLTSVKDFERKAPASCSSSQISSHQPIRSLHVSTLSHTKTAKRIARGLVSILLFGVLLQEVFYLFEPLCCCLEHCYHISEVTLQTAKSW